MDKLLSMVRRDFPDYETLRAFQAGIPVYFVRLAVEVLEQRELTSFEIYFLHAVALSVNTYQEIAHLLGIEDRDLVAPGANLLKLEFIGQGLPTPEKGRPIYLTEKGQQALKDQKAPPVPSRRTGRLHFNALTWVPIPLEENTWPVEKMGKEGLFLLPLRESVRPTLGDFTEKDVAVALRDTAAFQDKDIIALLELKKLELEYIAPVTVVLLQNRETGEQRLAVYRNSMFQRAESAAVQRFFENGKLSLPEDATLLKEEQIAIPLSLPPAIAQATRKLEQNENALRTLEGQLTEQKERQTSTQSDHERQELQERILQLKEELGLKREDNEILRQQLRHSQVEFLRTEQHRPILMQALREAREEIIIISPWMNLRTCNDELCRLIGDAIKRGVRVRIGYGIGKERDIHEAARNQNNVNAVRRALDRHIPASRVNLLEMRKTNGTHQKILVCDRTFAVTGSFNWLSYAGGQDEGYRNETGTLHRHIDQVNELVNIALRVMSS